MRQIKEQKNGYLKYDFSQSHSLYMASQVPKWIYLALVLLIIATHIAFLYGQVHVMWYLYFEADVKAEIKAITWDSALLFKTIGLKNPLFVDEVNNQKLQEFTYVGAVQKLWIAEGLQAKFIPRLGSILLVGFSGIWPHFKLLSLQFYLFGKSTRKARDKGLYWLGTFGKYSIADVFVVCILISVCNLHLTLNPQLVLNHANKLAPKIIKILENSVSERDAVRDICDEFLKLDCSDDVLPNFFAKPSSSTACTACVTIVEHTYESPSTLTSFVEEILSGIRINGTGHSNLSIAGLSGLHVFCVAVLSSMVLGFSVEYISHSIDCKQVEEAVPLLEEEGNLDNKNVTQLCLDKDNMHLNFYKRYQNSVSKRLYIIFVLFSLILLVFSCFAFQQKSMSRNVPGSIPVLINETMSIEFKEEYSFWDIINVIGGKGGFDYFLKLLFTVFCVAGPMVRNLLLFLVLVIPLKRFTQQRILYAIESLGVLCALDVFFIGIVLVQMEMGPITNTIIHSDSPFCKTLRLYGYPESCLVINFEITAFMFFIGVYFISLTVLTTIVVNRAKMANL